MRKTISRLLLTLLLWGTNGFSQDSLRLVNLYNSTGGHDWVNNTNWLGTLPISDWYGITVKDSSVIAIELSRNHLSGQLPNDIGQFAKLEILNLSDNNISGELPDSLKYLISIKYLNLSHNQINDNLNNTFGKLNKLVSLDISYNNILGNIPKDLGRLIHLEALNLSNNSLQNKIPIEIFRLHNIKDLNLQNNSLMGSIPRQIGNSINLQVLDLSRNKLSGSIPKEIGKLINLTRRLALDHNELDGPIPKEISLLSNLQHIWLNNNHFSGILPFEIGQMKSLKSIFIYQNNFVGPIPLTIGNLRELEIFYGQNNSFGGKVPQEFWFLPKLKMLRLENNQLFGIIPSDLRMLKSIQSINLSSNRFNSISDSIALPNSLLSFNVSYNNLFCDKRFGITDSNSLCIITEKSDKIIGLEQQNCNDNSIPSFQIGIDNIDFKYVMTDSTAEQQFWITSIDSVPNKLFLHNFDNNNFFITDTSIVILKNDTIFVSIVYSPIEVDNHYDVLIIDDVTHKNSQFITMVGEGVKSLIPERDVSIPWKFKLHPILTETESDTINIIYDIPETSNINITIYNLGGRPIKTIIDGKAETGFHSYGWNVSDSNGKPLEKGEYICVMQAGMFIQIQQILLLF
jgi:Leucine-rich repeat (LRR) protein